MGVRTAPPSSRIDRRFLPWILAAGVLAITWAVYRQAGGFSFILLDDMEYVTENPAVKAGLTADGAIWAFSAPHVSNWHPLTWLSHMADVELFGVDPGAHHLVNVAIHGANAVLLLLALHAMTGDAWRSAFVAALFAVHPLHVESVAWISERKDLLSTFFWLLTILAYAGYARRGGAGRYLAVLALFLLSLLSKAMPVTAPFLLLLLDFWPLGRFRAGAEPGEGARGPARPVLEKLPMLAISGLFSLAAFLAQETGGAVADLPLGARAANAVVSYAAYLRKAAWPSDLAVFYPHPSLGSGIAGWKVAAAALLLGALSLLAVRQARSRPWLFTGWFWYVGTLVPVIGLVQVGNQAMADRYTYFPLIGIFVAVAWTAGDPAAGGRFGRAIRFPAATAAVLALAYAASLQAACWRDSRTLFGEALAAVPNNYLARFNLGNVALMEGDVDGAVALYRASLRDYPEHSQARYNLACLLQRQGRTEEAAAEYRAVLKGLPGHAGAHNNLGNLLLGTGNREEAVFHFREAIRLDPSDDLARANLEKALGTAR
jgi:Flp pilus assembly protein TadD